MSQVSKNGKPWKAGSLMVAMGLCLGAYAQNSPSTTTINVKSIDILNKHLESKLDSLITIEKSCFSYNPKSVWAVNSKHIRGQDLLEITIYDFIVPSNDIIGFTHKQGVGVCFMGDTMPSVFKAMNEFVEIEVVPAGEFISIQDNSTWYYLVSEGRLQLLGAYPLPCD